VPTGDDEPDDWFVRADDQRWARADVPQASALLREIYQERGTGQAWGGQLQRHILATFSSDQVIPCLRQAISPPPSSPPPSSPHPCHPGQSPLSQPPRPSRECTLTT
jgi:hypothetical protein